MTKRDLKDIMKELYVMAKDKNLKIRFFFKNLRYILCIDGLIRARDKNFNIVSWSLAFGTRTPYDVLQTFKIEKIEVEESSGNMRVFERFDELLSWMKKNNKFN